MKWISLKRSDVKRIKLKKKKKKKYASNKIEIIDSIS